MRVFNWMMIIGLVACGSKGDDSATPPGDTDADADTDADTDSDTDADTDVDTILYSVSGMAVDLATSMPSAEGLCVDARDPDPAVVGGESVTISTSTVGAMGAFTISDINVKPDFGLLMTVYDCDETSTIVMTSSTPILPDLYANLAEGDTLADQTALVVSAEYRDGIQASLTAGGYTGGEVGTVGMMLGMVWDSKLVPIEGATVTGSAGTVYYQDEESLDGLFTTPLGLNTSTVALGGSIFVIPEAAVSTYGAKATGYTFPTNTAGSAPGGVLIAPLIAE